MKKKTKKLAASTFFVIKLMLHYALYAMGNDHSIVKSHIVGFIVSIVLSVQLTPMLEMNEIAIALLMAVTTIGVIKYWSFFILNKRWVSSDT
jgi:O-antigen/teichoic acid export membrane protein